MLHVALWLGVRGVVVVGVVIYSVILTQLLTTVESVSTQSCVCEGKFVITEQVVSASLST